MFGLRKRTKTVSIILALLVICAFSLSACTGSDNSAGDAPADSNGEGAEGSQGEVVEFSGNFIPAQESLTIKAYEHAAEYMKEKSDGRLILNIFPGGQLGGSDTENAESCAQNVFQMTTAPTHTIAQYSGFNEYAATTIPFLFTAPDQVDKYVDSDLLKPVNEKFTAETGLRIYGGFCDGFMGVSTVDKSFLAPSDIKGLKIRSQNAENYINTLNELGLSAIPMSAGEIFTALQQGTIDGISGISMMITNEHYYEVLKYYVDVNAFANYHMIVVNDGFYQGLPDDLKPIFDEAMVELVKYARETITGGIEDTYKICTDNGMEVTRLTDAQRQVWADGCKNTYNQMKEQVGTEIVSEIEKLLGE
jgi:TRAP-type C4-dicarboxylate transport system substrate-binding protein